MLGIELALLSKSVVNTVAEIGWADMADSYHIDLILNKPKIPSGKRPAQEEVDSDSFRKGKKQYQSK